MNELPYSHEAASTPTLEDLQKILADDIDHLNRLLTQGAPDTNERSFRTEDYQQARTLAEAAVESSMQAIQDYIIELQFGESDSPTFAEILQLLSENNLSFDIYLTDDKYTDVLSRYQVGQPIRYDLSGQYYGVVDGQPRLVMFSRNDSVQPHAEIWIRVDDVSEPLLFAFSTGRSQPVDLVGIELVDSDGSDSAL